MLTSAVLDAPSTCGVVSVGGVRVVYIDWSPLLIELLVVGAVAAAVMFFVND